MCISTKQHKSTPKSFVVPVQTPITQNETCVREMERDESKNNKGMCGCVFLEQWLVFDEEITLQRDNKSNLEMRLIYKHTLKLRRE
jgi:hypothetical protein